MHTPYNHKTLWSQFTHNRHICSIDNLRNASLSPIFTISDLKNTMKTVKVLKVKHLILLYIQNCFKYGEMSSCCSFKAYYEFW